MQVSDKLFSKLFFFFLKKRFIHVEGGVRGGALSYVEGFCFFEGRKANTEFSQNFPAVVEVGGIYKCMIYIKCPGTAMLNILTWSSR